MLTVNNISKSFQKDFWKKKKYALKDVSFSLSKGSITGFLGANGAGKTTLLKIILGFISKDTGNVQWDEEVFSGANTLSKIGYMPERPYYYPTLTGREFLTYCAALHSLNKDHIKNQIIKYASTFKIEHALDTYVKSYSKGMLQRLGFASALLHEPDFIILDEPLSGLDPVGRKEFKDAILELKSMGKSIFFSSHIVSDVEEVCENVVVLEQGEIVYSGAISDLVKSEADKYYTSSTARNDSLELKYKEFIQSTNSSHSFYKIPVSLKATFLDEVISNNVELDSLKLNIPSLEKIIYKIKDEQY